jgi:hypothetical protein
MTQHTDVTPLIAQALFNVSDMVDAYGALKAEAAALEAKMSAIKEALQATGRAEFREGALFDATMSISERESLSIKKMRDAGHGDLIAPYISKSDVYTLRCTAKKVK